MLMRSEVTGVETRETVCACPRTWGNLTNKLIKCLAVKLLANWADSGLPCLPLLQLSVQLLLQIDDIETSCWRAGHILHPELPIFSPLSVKIMRSKTIPPFIPLACGIIHQVFSGPRSNTVFAKREKSRPRFDLCLIVEIFHGQQRIERGGVASYLGGRMEFRMSSVCVTAAGALGASPFLPLELATRIGLSYRTSELTGGIIVRLLLQLLPLLPLFLCLLVHPSFQQLSRC